MERVPGHHRIHLPVGIKQTHADMVPDSEARGTAPDGSGVSPEKNLAIVSRGVIMD